MCLTFGASISQETKTYTIGKKVALGIEDSNMLIKCESIKGMLLMAHSYRKRRGVRARQDTMRLN